MILGGEQTLSPMKSQACSTNQPHHISPALRITNRITRKQTNNTNIYTPRSLAFRIPNPCFPIDATRKTSGMIVCTMFDTPNVPP